jgi:putative FmdB family regulatory protein
VPLYEYRCDDCTAVFETLASAARADEARCDHCGGARAHRLLSVFSTPRAAGSDGASAPTLTGGGCCGGACGSC